MLLNLENRLPLHLVREDLLPLASTPVSVSFPLFLRLDTLELIFVPSTTPLLIVPLPVPTDSNFAALGVP